MQGTSQGTADPRRHDPARLPRLLDDTLEITAAKRSPIIPDDAPSRTLPPFERIQEVLDVAVRRSPADETAVSCLETWSRRAGARLKGAPHIPSIHRNVLVRVMEAGRLGTFRCAAEGTAELTDAIRCAMAHARASEKVPGFPHLPRDDRPLPETAALWDEELVTLDPLRVRDHLARAGRSREVPLVEWREVRLCVASSHGLRRALAATEIELRVQTGRGTGAGMAAAARRRLDALPVEALFARARERASELAPGAIPPAPFPVLLAPEATAPVLDLLSRWAFTAEAYQFGDSFLREYLGLQVFDRAVTLMDDGNDPTGLPFPCDLEGSLKRPVPLIEKGVPRTFALDQLHAAILGLPPTPHATAGDDARAEHLHLAPGDADWSALLQAAEGGIWIGSLHRIECFDHRRLQIRAEAAGVRRIEGGRLAAPLPDLRWEVSLLQALGQIRALGRETETLKDPSGELGGTVVPAVVLETGTGLEVTGG